MTGSNDSSVALDNPTWDEILPEWDPHYMINVLNEMRAERGLGPVIQMKHLIN